MIIKPRSGPAPQTAYYNYYRNHIIVVIHGPNSLFSIGAEISRRLGRGLWAEASVGRGLRIETVTPSHLVDGYRSETDGTVYQSLWPGWLWNSTGLTIFDIPEH